MGRRTGTQQKWTNVNKIAWWCIIQPNLDEKQRPNPMPNIIPIMKSPDKLMIFLLYLWLLNRTARPRFTFSSLTLCIKIFPCFPGHRGRLFFGRSFLFLGWTWIFLGVLWNVSIWNNCSPSFVGWGTIFDFGILWIIRLEISFLMMISSDPIKVIDMHMVNIILSFLKWIRIRCMF